MRDRLAAVRFRRGKQFARPHVHAGSIPAFAFSHGPGVPCFDFTDGPAGTRGGDEGAGTDRPSVSSLHGTARRRKFAPW